MANTYSNLLYHVVFSTKNRLNLIAPDLQQQLYQYIGGIIRKENASLIGIGGMPDHVHLAIKTKTDVCLSDLMRNIKGSSSKWMNEILANRAKFAWQDGYGIFSVSESQIVAVLDYIRNQAGHHKKRTFQEEYLDFLKLHCVEFDEKYLWC